MGRKKKIKLEDQLMTFLEKRFIDLKENPDLFIMAGLTVVSFKTLREYIGDASALLYGALAFRLATTPSEGSPLSVTLLGVEIPYNSQSVGLTMLATLGIVPQITGFYDYLVETSKEAKSTMEKAISQADCRRIQNATGREEKALWHIWNERKPGCTFADWRNNCGTCPT